MTNKKPVTSIQELRYKMAEKFAALENGEITTSEAKAFVGIASVIVNSCKIEYLNNASAGVTDSIDFLVDQSKKPKEIESSKD